MYGRLSQYTGLHEFVDALPMPNVLVSLVGKQPERYSVVPSIQITTLRLGEDVLVTQPIRWEWRPFWARGHATPVNARAEEVTHGRLFNAVWRHRTLCPVSGWFEWMVKDGPRKQPYHIQHANGSPALCATIGQFPGLDDEPGEQHGFMVITADNAGGLVDIHGRRPVVLSPELAREWLDPAVPPERAEEVVLIQSEPNEAFTWYAVDPAAGSVRNQGTHPIEPQRSTSQAAAPAPTAIHPSGECAMSQIGTSTVWPSLGPARRITTVRRRSFEDGTKVLSKQWNAHIPCFPELPVWQSSSNVHFPANQITSIALLCGKRPQSTPNSDRPSSQPRAVPRNRSAASVQRATHGPWSGYRHSSPTQRLPRPAPPPAALGKAPPPAHLRTPCAARLSAGQHTPPARTSAPTPAPPVSFGCTCRKSLHLQSFATPAAS